MAKLLLAFLDAEGSQLFLRKTDNVVLGNICTIMRDPVTTRGARVLTCLRAGWQYFELRLKGKGLDYFSVVLSAARLMPLERSNTNGNVER
jgi:hypothetical protein